MPVVEQSQSEFFVHKPAYFKIVIGISKSGASFHKPVIPVIISFILLSPGIPKFPERDELNVRPSFQGVGHPHPKGAANKVHPEFVNQLRFPDIGDPPEFVQLESFVEMDGLRMHHFPVTQIQSPSLISFDRADTAAAVIPRNFVPVGTALPRTDEIQRPAVKVYTIDKILFALSRLTKMFRGWIIRIRRRAVC